MAFKQNSSRPGLQKAPRAIPVAPVIQNLQAPTASTSFLDSAPDHPLEQVIGEPSRPILTRSQLKTDGDMCIYALTVSIMEPKIVKEALTDPVWIESVQEELHQFIRLDPSDLGFSYEIEIASGQLVEIDKVIKGCKLEIEGHVFDINLIPFRSRSFDVIIGMDWNARNDKKRTRTCNAFATTTNPVRRENTGTAPKCTTCNIHPPPEMPCRTCFNCNRPRHFAKDFRVVTMNVNFINVRNPTARTCYECGSTDQFRAACPRLNQA
nr:reverse transcriptase domain-containing protein [Tanacetum cinerariifolium]